MYIYKWYSKVKSFGMVLKIIKTFASAALFLFFVQSLCDTWICEHKLLAEGGSANDRFGHAVSIFKDWAFVGAPYENGSAGAVHIFKYDGNSGKWREEQKIGPDDAGSVNFFGVSITVKGKIAIVGAHAENSGQGAAYIFNYDKTGKTWAKTQKIVPDDVNTGDNFGWSSAISHGKMIIGAKGDPNIPAYKGAAYIFNYDKEKKLWSLKQKLTAPDKFPFINPCFGWSVAIEDKWAIIGAPYSNAGKSKSGQAYIFKRSGKKWLPSQSIINLGGVDLLGLSVALSKKTMVIGIPYQDRHGQSSGEAHVYEYDSFIKKWRKTQILHDPEGAQYNNMGYSCAICSKYIVVGIPFYDQQGHNGGTLILFKKNKHEKRWVKIKKLFSSNNKIEDYVGYNVSIHRNKIIAGGPGIDDLGDESGAAFIYKFKDP